jgi:hypothetical protein
MFRVAPLYRSPKTLVGWAKVPKGMPPRKLVANDGAAAGLESSVGLVSGSPLHPAKAMARARDRVLAGERSDGPT